MMAARAGSESNVATCDMGYPVCTVEMLAQFRPALFTQWLNIVIMRPTKVNSGGSESGGFCSVEHHWLVQTGRTKCLHR
jgi:hypothetical protein